MLHEYKSILKKSDWIEENNELIQTLNIEGVIANPIKTVICIDTLSVECDTKLKIDPKIMKSYNHLYGCITETDKIIFHLSKTNELVIDIPIIIYQVAEE